MSRTPITTEWFWVSQARRRSSAGRIRVGAIARAITGTAMEIEATSTKIAPTSTVSPGASSAPPIVTPSGIASASSLGLVIDSNSPRPNARAGEKPSIAFIQPGSFGSVPAGLGRHLLRPSTMRATPMSSLITVGMPVPLAALYSSSDAAMMIASMTARPRIRPTRNVAPAARPCGDMSSSTTEISGKGLSATPTASGSAWPMTSTTV